MAFATVFGDWEPEGIGVELQSTGVKHRTGLDLDFAEAFASGEVVFEEVAFAGGAVDGGEPKAGAADVDALDVVGVALKSDSAAEGEGVER